MRACTKKRIQVKASLVTRVEHSSVKARTQNTQNAAIQCMYVQGSKGRAQERQQRYVGDSMECNR